MDERAIKRLLIMVVVSIIAILVFKKILTKTAINVNKAVVEKKQAASAKPPTVQQAPSPSPAPAIIESPAASSVTEATTMDTPASSPAASSVSEVR